MINKIDKVKILDLQLISSKGSTVNVFENLNKFFTIKRIFTVQMNNFYLNERGRHAHIIDKQIVTCPYGSIKFKVTDGKKSKNFILKNPSKAIYVPNQIWTETTYLEKKSVVICYCSENYNEKSYIRDYDKFLNFRKNLKFVNQISDKS